MPLDPNALLAAQRAAPQLDPTILYGVAAATPDDAVTNAQATQAYSDVTKRVANLKNQDGSVQRSVWAGMTDDEKQQFTSAGYGGPPAQHSGGGLFGAVAGAVGHAISAVSSVPLHAAGEALHYAGAPLRQLQHAFRAGERISGLEALGGAGLGAVVGGALGSFVPVVGTAIGAGVGSFIGGAALPALTHPQDWADSWKKTENGEASFTASAERAVTSRYGTDTYDLAAQIAGGKSQEQILAQVPEDQRDDLATRMRTDGDLRDAVNILANGKMSMGRLLTQTIGLHPSSGVGRVISGVTDGVADWFGDPAMAVAKGAKAAELVRYGVRTGEDVERLYNTNGAVKAAFEDVADHLARHAAQVEQAGGGAALAEKMAAGGDGNVSALGELLNRHPQLAPVIPTLVKENITTAEELKDWMAGQKGFEQLLRGQVTGAAKQALLKGQPLVLLPRLTTTGEAGLAAKQAVTKAIDFAAESDSRFPRALGRFGRMATTLTPRGMEFDINGDEALTTIQRVAKYVLPDARVNDYVGAWAAADTAGKRTLYKGLLAEMFDHAGVNDTAQGQEWAAHFVDGLEQDARHRAYATGGKDLVDLPSGPAATGFLEGHLQETWSLPSYKALWAQSKRGLLANTMDGTVNRDMIDRFMQNTWKPLSLLRIGFPIRSGGEELASAIMREGPAGLIRGRLATTAIKGESAEAQGGTHLFQRIWHAYTGDMTPEEVEAMRTPADFVGRVFGNRTARVMNKVRGALAGDEYMQAARELYERGTLGDAFANEISATHGRGVGFHWDTDSMDKINRDGGRVRGMVIRPTGDFKDYLPSEPHFEQIWRRNLDELGDSELGRIALSNIDNRDEAINQLVDHLESDRFAKLRTRATRADFLRDGRSVAAGEATPREASIDWANTIYDHAVDTVTSAGGAVESPVVSKALSDVSPGDRIRLPGQQKFKKVDAFVDFNNEPIPAGLDQDTLDLMAEQRRLFVKWDDGNLSNHWPASQMVEVQSPAAAAAATAHESKLAALDEEIARARREVGDLGSEDGPGANSPEYQAATARRDALMQQRRVLEDQAAVPAAAVGGHVMVDGKTLAEHVLDGTTPTPKQLGELGLDARPSGLKGPVVVAEPQNWIGALTDKGFSRVVGPMMDWMVREPLFIHNYATSKKEIAGLTEMLERSGLEGDQLAQHVHDVAVDRAINKTVPYIHDPRMKSQLSVVGRNIAPFWFAQEQFFKRWVNIFQHSPEAFREAQLTMNGLRHMGWIHTDQQGNDYFMYPAVGALQNVLQKGFKTLTGHDASIPLPLNFSGQVRFATPGLERLGLPSFGPLISLPTTYLTNRFPELLPAQQGILGERGAGRPLWEQLVPTTLSRAIHAISDTADNPGQMHSAVMQAMAYLEAHGHGVPDGASPAETEAWMDRVKNWARVLMVTRTLYGYAAPAAPEAVFDPDNLHQEFQGLLKSMPIDQAVGTFIKAHPDATAYTVFQTKSASGAPLPATEKSLEFMDQNREFLDAYPQAGGWFLPQKDSSGQFSMTAYREQMATQMRQSKTLDEYYRNIKFAEAADTYFDTKDHKDALLKNAQGPAKTAIAQKWTAWADNYKAQHPIFAEELLSSDGQIRRQQTLDQLRTAVDDPRMPKNPQTQAMATLIKGWDTYQAATGALTGRRDFASTHTRANLKAAFTNWGNQFVKDHPDIQSLWNRTIRIELGGA